MPLDFLYVPPGIANDHTITLTEAVVLGKIATFSSEGGICIANNRYFAKVTRTSTSTITRVLAKFVKQGIVTSALDYKLGSKQVHQRVLTLTEKGIKKYIDTPSHSEHTPSHGEHTPGHGEHTPLVTVSIPPSHSEQDITVLDNIKDNIRDIDVRVKSFESKVRKHSEYSTPILDAFIDYWSELNRSKTKMLFETKRTFEISRRLKTWNRNNETNFGRNNGKTVEAKEETWKQYD